MVLVHQIAGGPGGPAVEEGNREPLRISPELPDSSEWAGRALNPSVKDLEGKLHPRQY
jgi:hypothetical protein